MDLVTIVLLSFIQGLTEFLPVSSSAHLVLFPSLTGSPDQGLAFDIAVHIGSLFAVIHYLRHQLITILGDMKQQYLNGKNATDSSHLGMVIIVATLPIVIAGGIITLLDVEFRSPIIIASTSIVFGLLLWWADSKPARTKAIEEITWKNALFIGSMQILSIIPGTSRSGITMTAALMLGFTRTAASRFSFLLAIPTILMSSMVVIYKIIKHDAALDIQAMFIGAGLSFIFAWLAIHYFLKLIERTGMLPYIIYRVLLGVILLAIFI